MAMERTHNDTISFEIAEHLAVISKKENGNLTLICNETNKIQLEIILSVIALTPSNATEFCEYEISIDEFCKLVMPSNPRMIMLLIIPSEEPT